MGEAGGSPHSRLAGDWVWERGSEGVVVVEEEEEVIVGWGGSL